MAGKPKLDPRVLTFLHEKLKKPVGTIRSDISRLRQEYSRSTLNAVAQIYAVQHNISVRRLISKEDKLTIPSLKIEKRGTPKTKKTAMKRERIKEIIKFETSEHFLKKHIEEINKAYSRGCYTCVFVLIRKVFENLIIGVLKSKFPANPELHLDISKGRNLDFSVVLDNLLRKRTAFEKDKSEAIKRLHQKLKPFKADANDKVHSLYHIVENSKEIDDWNVDTIMALFAKII